MKEDLSLLSRLHHGLCKAIEKDGTICFGPIDIIKLGYCKKHCGRYYKYKTVNLPIKKIKRCSYIDCKNKYARGGYCSTHYSNKWSMEKRKAINKVIPKCLIESCNETNYVKGYCNKHYLKLCRYGDPNYKQKRNNGYSHRNVLGRRKWDKCIAPECGFTSDLPNTIIKGLCLKHYNRWLKYKSFNLPVKMKKSCMEKDCEGKYMAKGFCRKHYERFMVHGDHTIVLPKGRPKK